MQNNSFFLHAKDLLVANCDRTVSTHSLPSQLACRRNDQAFMAAPKRIELAGFFVFRASQIRLVQRNWIGVCGIWEAPRRLGLWAAAFPYFRPDRAGSRDRQGTNQTDMWLENQPVTPPAPVNSKVRGNGIPQDWFCPCLKVGHWTNNNQRLYNSRARILQTTMTREGVKLPTCPNIASQGRCRDGD